MSEKKIADSIIIRVGGGIREVPRETGEDMENLEAVHLEPDVKQPEDVPPFGVEVDLDPETNTEKIIN